MRHTSPTSAIWIACALLLLAPHGASAQSFGLSTLDFDGLGGVSMGTSLAFGPDGRLYVLQIDGTIDVFEIERRGPDDYAVIGAEEIVSVRNHPNHDDDGSSNASIGREATGLAVGGTASNPVLYASSSDSRVGGPSGDKDLDTNSGVITRLAWQGVDRDDPSGFWEGVDLVRGLPRSEENHATNGIEIASIGGRDYLLVAQGGHTNAGSPSTNFAWSTEYALAAALLAVDLTTLESMPVSSDGGRDFVYDLPTLDDPTRANANGIEDPDAPGYDGVDLLDPWGGNDGLNQAVIVPGGPVQIFSPGYRNAYDLVLTESGAVYVTDNGANGGWGGYPDGEGLAGNATNAYRPGEPGSNGADPVYGDPQVNNQDHLSRVTDDVESYVFGSFYGGHPAPVRANPAGAGLFTRGSHSSDPGDSNGNGYTDDWFRTVPYDPSAGGEAGDPSRALPADWPPVPIASANPVEGDFRNPGGANPDGPVDDILGTWGNNSNGIDEYTASNFGGAMQGDLIAGRSGGRLHRVQLNPDGSLDTLSQDWISNLGGNPLGITANGDADPFPGTIWVATFNADIVVLEPQDFVECVLPGDPGYDPDADGDSDGYSNDDEEQNATDPCNGGSQPGDFDKAAGAPLVSDLLDPDDDADGVDDALDPLQLGDPTDAGSDAFDLPVTNELFSDNAALGGYLGLGFTGLMNNGDPNPNWQLWLDQPGAGPNPNDVLGGAVGAVTMHMGEGTAFQGSNDQTKGFQYGVNADLASGGFTVRSRLLNLGAGLQLYPTGGDAELGIFVGDGSQSDYVQLLVWRDGVDLLQEQGDVAQVRLGYGIGPGLRPDASVELELRVDAASGAIEGWFGLDGGPLERVGEVYAQGSLLDAIQATGTPVVVGVIGSSHAPGVEVEGTWDYLSVEGRQPFAAQPLPDVVVGPGAAPQQIDLGTYFGDDAGASSLVYTVEGLDHAGVSAVVSGSTLTLEFPGSAASATIVVRATDAEGLFFEQSFQVEVAAPAVLYRLNAGGSQLAAIDGGIPWEADSATTPSARLSVDGGNNTAGFGMTGYTPEVDLSTTPTALFDTERWSSTPAAPSMAYSFPLADGSYELRLYLGNGYGGTNDPGERVFDVEIEGVAHPDLTGLDLSASYGHQVGAVVSHPVTVSDGALDVEFFHGPANNPLVNGIEVLGGSGGGGPGPGPQWIDLDEDEGYTPRHECSFVQAGDRFFLFGGRENPQTLDTYDYAGDGWSTRASAPLPFNHFQATEHEGLIWVIGAFETNSFPSEDPADDIYAYDPARDVWMQGPTIPVARRRGSAGLVVHDGTFYVVGGNTQGHSGGYVPWLDAFDPRTGTWTALPDAPHARDHHHSVVVGDSLYVLGGRLSGGAGGTFAPLVPEVDVYDFGTGTWSTLPPASNLPTPRAASAVAFFQGEILVMGGETASQSQAYTTVEALDPVGHTWRALPSMNHPRHGTQAIVSGNGVYVAAGSPSMGGGNQHNMEVYNAHSASGAPSTAGVLSVPGTVNVASGSPKAIALEHDAGNTGLFVTQVSLGGPDAADFSILTPVDAPFLVPVAGERVIEVTHQGAPGGEASLEITYGGGLVASVTLMPEPGAAASLAAGVIALLGLARRRRGPSARRITPPRRA